jgi:hypothetical protein
VSFERLTFIAAHFLRPGWEQKSLIFTLQTGAGSMCHLVAALGAAVLGQWRAGELPLFPLCLEAAGPGAGRCRGGRRRACRG